jgi:molybdate transport system substrate-binding protein
VFTHLSLFLFVLLARYAAAAQTADGIVVLAAASLTNVLQDIGKTYEPATHRNVAFSFTASMILAKQIEPTSGADMFISADSNSMNYLDTRGVIAKPTRRDLLANSLVLVAPAGSKVMLDMQPGFKLAEALQGGRLALATPEAVPAGKYGQTALVKLGVWGSVGTCERSECMGGRCLRRKPA